MKFSLCVKDLHNLIGKVNYMHGRYASCFVTKTRSVVKQSFQYIQGKLLGKGGGVICVVMQKNVPDCDSQSLQYFISDSPWDHEPVIDDIQQGVTRFIGG